MEAKELDARALVASTSGNNLQALRDLIAANRITPDPEREIKIRDLRLTTPPCSETTPRLLSGNPVALSQTQSMPTCSAADLSPEVVQSAFAQSGCLYVPGILGAEEIDVLRNAIEDAQVAGGQESRDPSWNNPPKSLTRDNAIKLANVSHMAYLIGGVLAVNAPSAMFKCCDMLERHGLFELAQNYFGEAPIFSATKFMLWRVQSESVGQQAAWHQDGRFLGDMHDIKSLNVWTALTDCGEGEDAPGMELVLESLDHYVMPDDERELAWTVSENQVEDFRKRVPVVIPRFKAGDMLLFDHWFLHRTSRLPGMTKSRYAIEAWLFAPSGFPGGRMPVTV